MYVIGLVSFGIVMNETRFPEYAVEIIMKTNRLIPISSLEQRITVIWCTQSCHDFILYLVPLAFDGTIRPRSVFNIAPMQ